MKLIEVAEPDAPKTFDEFVKLRRHVPHPASYLVVTLEQYIKCTGIKNFKAVNPAALENRHITSFGVCPELLPIDLYLTDQPITSLVGAPKHINGNLDISGMPKLVSYHHMYKHIKQINGVLWIDCKPGLLGILLIEGIHELRLVSNTLTVSRVASLLRIFERHLETRDINLCQEELIDAGFAEYARL